MKTGVSNDRYVEIKEGVQQGDQVLRDPRGLVRRLAPLLDDAGKAPANKKPVVGNIAVAQFIIAVTRTLPADANAVEIDLNGAPALVLKTGDHPIVAILIDTDGERIRSVFAIANPDKLRMTVGTRLHWTTQ